MARNTKVRNKNMEYENKYKSDVLNNITCPYCGKFLNDAGKTKDHVIGKKFVPKGSLDKEYNLILNACIKCNNEKSDLEDDISAITQLNSIVSHEDRTTIIEKASGSFSRFTKRKVIDSYEQFEVTSNFNPYVQMSVLFRSKPQINTDRANVLAHMHLQAFYYLQSYRPDSRKGLFIPNPFVCVLNTIQSDWGNTINIQFMEMIKNWEIRANCITAKGNFKLNTRKNGSALCWSWALEWNQYYRLIGFFGDELEMANVAKLLKIQEPSSILRNNESTIRTYIETKLLPEQDSMFIFP